MAVNRKLAAILVADIAGYSRLMREDEEGTYIAVQKLRDETLREAVGRHGGLLTKEMGDGFLITFDSAVHAVECAIALQQALVDHDVLELRIGVNMGDVIVEADDVFGDGVNVAARLEAICTPGSVAMSESIYEQVRDKLDLSVETLKPQQLKNIDRPVGVRLWSAQTHSQIPVDKLTLPDKPSIAVLAFVNMSSDAEQEFFADGIAEDIITALSRIERFFVISRTSSFSFKGQNVDVKTIGRTLAVRYVLEGSVRAVGTRLRVTAQLIEAATGRHIWAEKYDRMIEDIFDIQDEITMNIAATIQTQIDFTEGEKLVPLPRVPLPVWKLTNIAWKNIYLMTTESLSEAIELAKHATEIAPRSGRAWQVLSSAYYHHVLMNYPEDADLLMGKSEECAERAVQLSPNDEYAHWARGLVSGYRRDYERAISCFERAIEINPNCSLAYGSLGSILARAGHPNDSIEKSMTALRSNPRDPSRFLRYQSLGLANYLLDRFDEAEKWCNKAMTLKPEDFRSHVYRIAVLEAKGDHSGAVAALEHGKAQFDDFSLKRASIHVPENPTERERYFTRLKAAGLI